MVRRHGHGGRRGKYLLLALDDDRELVVHLGMTGSLRSPPAGDVGDAYVRAWWKRDGGPPGGGGGAAWSTGTCAASAGSPWRRTGSTPDAGVQGPDALDRRLTPEEFWRALRQPAGGQDPVAEPASHRRGGQHLRR